MIERVIHLLHSSKNNYDSSFWPSHQYSKHLPTMGTFHSICCLILREHIHLLGYSKNFMIYDSNDQKSAMKITYKNMKIDEKDIPIPLALYSISQLKNMLLKPEIAHCNENSNNKQLISIYKNYQELLKKNNALDFDDIIMKATQLLQKHSDVLEKYQDTWKYICIDEYQDTNFAQHQFIRLIASKHKNICVVGDADQSIYAFRGANIKNILSFKKEYSDAKLITLKKNYRSTQNIINAANSLIENNTQRLEKDMESVKEEGEKVRLLDNFNENNEAEMITQEIYNLHLKNQIPLSDFAILYRTNAQSRILEESFLRANISYKIIGGLKFYSRKEIKDIIAYLRLIANPHDDISLLRIINVPPRKIGKTTITKISQFAKERNISIFEVIKHINVVENLGQMTKKALIDFKTMFEKLIQENEESSFSYFIDILMNNSGYKKMLSMKEVENISRLENIEELKSVTSKYDKYEENALQYFLEEIALVEDTDEIRDGTAAVTLMTIHASKGLEYSHVFIVGLEEKLFPHERSLSNESEIEEERRLMYVAMTRAKEKLYLSYVQNRTIFGKSTYNPLSRFITEINPDFLNKGNEIHEIQSEKQKAFTEENDSYVYDDDSQVDYVPEYKEGMKIEHSHYGRGTIVSVVGGVLTISFGPGNVRKIAASIAPMKVIEE